MSHKHWKLVEEEEPAHGKCAHCGYCSCCGRGAYPITFIPTYPQPYMPTYPYTVWSSGTTSVSAGNIFGGTTTVDVIS